MLAGLASGSAAAIAASLVQLPLHSPVDVVFNSLTVTVGSLAAGVLAGLLWVVARRDPRRRLIFFTGWGLLLAAVLGAAAAGDAYLDRTLSFIGPLAAIVMVVTGAGTPALAGSDRVPTFLVVIAVVAAIGVGAGLATQGDAASGRLELPPRALAPAVPAPSDPETASL